MSEPDGTRIRSYRPEDLSWTPTGEADPEGREAVTFRSFDGRFVCGLWERGAQTGPERFVREYHEVAYVLEGRIRVETDDDVVEAGPGDVLVTPKGSRGLWTNLAPVRKFWVIDKEP